MEIIKKIISKIENSKIGFWYFVFSFFAICSLRVFLELFSDNDKYGSVSGLRRGPIIHFYLSYIALALILTILISIGAKERIVKIARLVFCFFFVLVSVPVFDLVLSSGRGYDIAYLLPGIHDIPRNFLTFFSNCGDLGISPGMRIEIALVLLISFIYFLIKTKKILRSVFFSFLVYIIIFAYLSVPFLIKRFLGFFDIKYEYSDALLGNFYLLLIFFFVLLCFCLHKFDCFIEILKDIRPFRLAHYELMFILGIALAKKQLAFINLDQNELFSFFFVLVAVIFAWLFSVITNNLADLDIDRITNKKRPSVSGAISVEDYKKIALFCFIPALVYSLAAGFKSFFLIFLFIGNYFLYSMPPFRLKKLFFLSKIFISLNSLVLFMLGYVFFTGGNMIPANIVFLFVVGLTPALNFIDIKDYKGDKKTGIKTLPVILGLEKSKFIIGLFGIWFYILFPVLIGAKSLLFFSVILGLIQFYFVTKKQYSEIPIFITHLSGLIFVIAYFVF